MISQVMKNLFKIRKQRMENNKERKIICKKIYMNKQESFAMIIHLTIETLIAC